MRSRLLVAPQRALYRPFHSTLAAAFPPKPLIEPSPSPSTPADLGFSKNNANRKREIPKLDIPASSRRDIENTRGGDIEVRGGGGQRPQRRQQQGGRDRDGRADDASRPRRASPDLRGRKAKVQEVEREMSEGGPQGFQGVDDDRAVSEEGKKSRQQQQRQVAHMKDSDSSGAASSVSEPGADLGPPSTDSSTPRDAEDFFDVSENLDSGEASSTRPQRADSIDMSVFSSPEASTTQASSNRQPRRDRAEERGSSFDRSPRRGQQSRGGPGGRPPPRSVKRPRERIIHGSDLGVRAAPKPVKPVVERLDQSVSGLFGRSMLRPPLVPESGQQLSKRPWVRELDPTALRKLPVLRAYGEYKSELPTSLPFQGGGKPEDRAKAAIAWRMALHPQVTWEKGQQAVDIVEKLLPGTGRPGASAASSAKAA